MSMAVSVKELKLRFYFFSVSFLFGRNFKIKKKPPKKGAEKRSNKSGKRAEGYAAGEAANNRLQQQKSLLHWLRCG